MEDIAKVLILSGMALSMLAQIVGMFLIFSVSVMKAFFCLIIPGYIFLALKQHGYYKQVIGTWLLGVVLLVIGMSILS